MRNEFESRKAKLRRERKEFKELTNNSKFEKGDWLALIIAACTTILPFAVIIFIVLFLIPMVILRLF